MRLWNDIFISGIIGVMTTQQPNSWYQCLDTAAKKTAPHLMIGQCGGNLRRGLPEWMLHDPSTHGLENPQKTVFLLCGTVSSKHWLYRNFSEFDIVGIIVIWRATQVATAGGFAAMQHAWFRAGARLDC